MYNTIIDRYIDIIDIKMITATLTTGYVPGLASMHTLDVYPVTFRGSFVLFNLDGTVQLLSVVTV